MGLHLGGVRGRVWVRLRAEKVAGVVTRTSCDFGRVTFLVSAHLLSYFRFMVCFQMLTSQIRLCMLFKMVLSLSACAGGGASLI